MKFFSNEAKENSDEPYGRDHSDVVTSDPVAVPQQRAGSPWSDAPSTTEAETPSTTETDAEAGSPDDELADQERRDGTGEEPASRRDETDTVTTYHPDGTVDTEEHEDLEARADESVEDDAVKDEGTFDSPQAVEPATGEPLTSESEPASDAESDADDDAGADPALRRDVAAEPAAVTATETAPGVDEADRDREVEKETATDRAQAQAQADDTVAETRADEAVAESEQTPVAAAAAAPGSVPAPALDRLFADGDSFAERFRDIQLRFVDSPKEATADAAALVGEAVDKLTGALQAQKDALGGDSDDTEQLRVQLRSYRDLLNRLSAL